MRKARPTTTVRIKYLGLDLDVEFEVYPAQRGGMSDPSWDAGIDIEGVTLADHDVDISELIDNIKPKSMSLSTDVWDEIEALVMEEGEELRGEARYEAQKAAKYE